MSLVVRNGAHQLFGQSGAERHGERQRWREFAIVVQGE